MGYGLKAGSIEAGELLGRPGENVAKGRHYLAITLPTPFLLLWVLIHKLNVIFFFIFLVHQPYCSLCIVYNDEMRMIAQVDARHYQQVCTAESLCVPPPPPGVPPSVPTLLQSMYSIQ